MEPEPINEIEPKRSMPQGVKIFLIVMGILFLIAFLAGIIIYKIKNDLLDITTPPNYSESQNTYKIANDATDYALSDQDIELINQMGAENAKAQNLKTPTLINQSLAPLQKIVPIDIYTNKSNYKRLANVTMTDPEDNDTNDDEGIEISESRAKQKSTELFLSDKVINVISPFSSETQKIIDANATVVVTLINNQPMATGLKLSKPRNVLKGQAKPLDMPRGISKMSAEWQDFDARNFLRKRGQRLPPLKSQGTCGCCWAFAVMTCLSYRLGFLSNTDGSPLQNKNGPRFPVDLSPLYLMSAYSQNALKETTRLAQTAAQGSDSLVLESLANIKMGTDLFIGPEKTKYKVVGIKGISVSVSPPLVTPFNALTPVEYNTSACDGNSIDGGFMLVKKYGIVTEGSLPYPKYADQYYTNTQDKAACQKKSVSPFDWNQKPMIKRSFFDVQGNPLPIQKEPIGQSYQYSEGPVACTQPNACCDLPDFAATQQKIPPNLVSKVSSYSANIFLRLSGQAQVFDENEIKKEILTRGPVCAGVLITDEFMDLVGNGIITKKETDFSVKKFPVDPQTGMILGPYHAIVVIGWGREPSTGINYWVIHNSWGTSWGENGYGKVEMGALNMFTRYNPAYAGSFADNIFGGGSNIDYGKK